MCSRELSIRNLQKPWLWMSQILESESGQRHTCYERALQLCSALVSTSLPGAPDVGHTVFLRQSES